MFLSQVSWNFINNFLNPIIIIALPLTTWKHSIFSKKRHLNYQTIFDIFALCTWSFSLNTEKIEREKVRRECRVLSLQFTFLFSCLLHSHDQFFFSVALHPQSHKDRVKIFSFPTNGHLKFSSPNSHYNQCFIKELKHKIYVIMEIDVQWSIDEYQKKRNKSINEFFLLNSNCESCERQKY